MRYTINSGCLTNKGKIRDINQDNFYFNDKYLTNNDSLDNALIYNAYSKDGPIYAVFDGMGGESKGEEASLIASRKIKSHPYKLNTLTRINNLLLEINDEICNKMLEDKTRMGTTAAICKIEKNKLLLVNIGDTKIFRLRDDKLSMLSIDHTEKKENNTKGKLTQHLGILTNEMQIMPYKKEESIKLKDKILLCTDGLTDMVDENTIKNILSQNKDVALLTEELINKANSNGGKDNTTVIVLEITNRKIFSNLITKILIALALIICTLLTLYLTVFKKGIKVTEIDPLVVGNNQKLEYQIKGYKDYTIDISNKKIAEYQDGYIYAKKEGETFLEIIDNKGNIIYSTKILVFPN